MNTLLGLSHFCFPQIFLLFMISYLLIYTIILCTLIKSNFQCINQYFSLLKQNLFINFVTFIFRHSSISSNVSLIEENLKKIHTLIQAKLNFPLLLGTILDMLPAVSDAKNCSSQLEFMDNTMIDCTVFPVSVLCIYISFKFELIKLFCVWLLKI